MKAWRVLDVQVLSIVEPRPKSAWLAQLGGVGEGIERACITNYSTRIAIMATMDGRHGQIAPCQCQQEVSAPHWGIGQSWKRINKIENEEKGPKNI